MAISMPNLAATSSRWLHGPNIGCLVRPLVYTSVAIFLALLLSLSLGQEYDGGDQKLRGEPRIMKREQPVHQVKEPFAYRPRISTRNGHLLIEASLDKNIDFRSGARGTITVNGHKLDQLLSVAKALEKSSSLGGLSQTNNADGNTQQNQYEQIVSTLFGASQRFLALERNIQSLNEQLKSMHKFGRQVRKELQQVSALSKQQEKIASKLKRNDCFNEDTGQPVCKNGATCVDAYDSFKCLCPSNWEGPTCEEDVDECAKFRGTDLGCQNGARCLNTRGGYRCECPPQYHGIHCTEQHDDCSLSSARSLCGNGKCINLARNQPNQARYECLCDQGWTTDGINPACTIDINECLLGQSFATNLSTLIANPAVQSAPWGSSLMAAYPCSQNPFVECINLSGSFQCGPCPPGYTGNGRLCRDLDECATDNGGCSMSPLVECINLPGSRRCGSCPPGYTGDGLQCWQVGACQQEPLCHPMASCTELAAISATSRLCTCRPPYVGDGVGPSGCIMPPLVTEQQQNATSASPVMKQDDCSPNPCMNAATCQLTGDSFECICPTSWSGRLCEDRVRPCGGRYFTSSGDFVFPRGNDFQEIIKSSNYYNPNSTGERQILCKWEISVARNMSVKLILTDVQSKIEPNKRPQYYLTNLTNHAPPNCEEHLDIIEKQVDMVATIHGNYNYIAPSDASRLVARICNHRKPITGAAGQIVPRKEPIAFMMESNTLELEYSLAATRTQFLEPSLTFAAKWQKFEPVCGGELPVTDSGYVSSPKFPEFYPAGSECRYLLRVPQGKRIRLQFGELNLLTGRPNSNLCMDSLTIIDGSIGPNRPVLFRYCANNSTIMGRVQSPPPIVSSSSRVELILLSSAQSSTPLMKARQKRGFFLTYASESAIPGCGGLFSAKSAQIRSSDFEPPAISLSASDQAFALQANKYFELKNNRPVNEWRQRNAQTANSSSSFTASAPVARCEYEIRPADQGRDHKIAIDWLEMPTDQLIDSSSLSMWSRRLGCTRGRLAIYDGNPLDASNRTEIASFCSGDRYNASLTDQLQPIVSSGHVLYLVYESALVWPSKQIVGDGDMMRSSTVRGFRLQYSTVCTAVYYQLSDRIKVELEQEVSECVYHIVLPANNSISLMIEPKMSDSMSLPDGSCAAQAIFMDGALPRNPRALIAAERLMRIHKFGASPTDDVSSSSPATAAPSTRVGEKNSGGTTDDFSTELGAGISAALETATALPYYQYSSSSAHDIKEFDVCRSTMLSFDSIWNHLSLMFRLSPAARDLLSPAVNSLDAATSESAGRVGKRVSLSVKYQNEPACGGIVTEPREGSLILEASRKAPGLSAFPLTSQRFEQLHRDQLVSPCAWILRNANNQLIRVRFEAPDKEIKRRYDEWLKWSNKRKDSHGRGVSPDDSLLGGSKFNCSSIFQEFIELYEPSINRTRFLCPIEFVKSDNADERLHLWTTQSDTLFIRLRNTSNTETGNATDQWPGKRPLPNGLISVKYTMLQERSNNCGGKLFHDSGIITTPRFPFNYPPFSHCVWIIQAQPNQQIRLNFTTFKLERQKNCLFDHLELRNGPAIDSPLIGRFCNQDLQSRVLVSHSNLMRLTFRSDAHLNRAGFQIYYDGAQTGCGGKLSSPSGQIDSPNYPLAYAHAADCEWTIEISESNRIRLSVDDLDLSMLAVEQVADCPSSNYLEIFDSGAEFTTRSLGRFCHKSQMKQLQFVSSGNKLHIVYRSQALDQSRGFRLTYETQCAEVRLTGFQGAIESPGYPSGYQPRSSCGWFVRAPTGSNLTLVIADLEIENTNLLQSDSSGTPSMQTAIGRVRSGGNYSRQCNDKLRIFAVQLAFNETTMRQEKFKFPSYSEMQANRSAAMGARNMSLKRSLCGRLSELDEQDRAIEINSNGAYVTFESDRSVDFRGFRIEWKARGCGGLYLSESVGPISYEEPNNDTPIECLWTIDLSRSANMLDLNLNSDMRLPDSSVLMANGSRSFDPCHEASLTIYDGLTEDAPILTRNCDAHKLRETIATSSAQALVKFVSSGRHHSTRGFVLNTWPSIREGCMSSIFDLNTPFNVQAGSRESPNYPELYDATSYRCHGILSTHNGRLRFSLDELDIPIEATESPASTAVGLLEPEKCLKSGNYLMLRNYARNIDEVYCGKLDKASNASRTEVIFEQEAAWFEFVTKSALRGKWRFTFDRLCGSLVSIESSYQFSTPNYPARPSWPAKEYPANEYAEKNEKVCLWRLRPASVIEVSMGEATERANHRLHLSIMDFRQSRTRPEIDCLRIYEGVNITLGQSQFNLTYLDTKLPPKIKICSDADLTHNKLHYMSRGNELTVLVSGDAVAKFSVKLFENYCGGEFHLDKAEFASPDYPLAYGPNLDCNYFIVSSPGASIALEFLKFDLPNGQSPLISGGAEGTSCDNVDYIELRHLPAWRKVSASLRMIGGNVYSSRWSDVGYLMAAANSTSNSTKTENFAQKSPKPKSNRLYELAKIYYTLADGANSGRVHTARSSINVESFYESSKLIGRYCGGKNAIDASKLNLGDEILIRFRSHSKPNDTTIAKKSESHQGFLAKYTIVYGGPIKVDSQETSGLISSPNFPEKHKGGGKDPRIRWTFSTSSDSVLQFDLVSLDLGPIHQECQDTLSIFDGLDPLTSSQLAVMCGHLSFRNLAYRRMGTNWGNGEVKPIDMRQLPTYLAHNSRVRANLVRSVRSSSNVASVVYDNSRNEGSFLLRYTSTLKSALNLTIQDELSANPTSLDIGMITATNEDDNNELTLTKDGRLVSKSCSGSYKLSSGPNGTEQIVLSSPNWPQEPPDDIECHWLLSTREDATIKFFVDPVDTSSPGSDLIDPLQAATDSSRFNDCFERRNLEKTRSFIIVHDGATRLAPVIARKCLPVSLTQLQSSGRQMLIRYVYANALRASNKPAAPTSHAFKGRASIGKCGGQFHVIGSTRIQDRLDKSKLYENNLNCKYYIFASSQERVLVINSEMSDFQLASEPTNAECSVGDYIEIRDMPIQNDMLDFSRQNVGRLLGRFCAGHRLEYLETPGSAISIEFRTDAANAAKGWDLFIMSSQPRLLCPRGYHKIDLDVTFGRIISPNWPHGVSGKRLCKFLLIAPHNKTIELTFVRLKRPKLSSDSRVCSDKLRYLDDNEAIALRYNSQPLDELVSPLSGTLLRSLVQEVPCRMNLTLTQTTYDYAQDSTVRRLLEETDGSNGVKEINAEKYQKLLALAPTNAYKISSNSHTLLLDYMTSNLAPSEGFVGIYRVIDQVSEQNCGGEVFAPTVTSQTSQLSLSAPNPNINMIEAKPVTGKQFQQCDWTINQLPNWLDSRTTLEVSRLSAASNSTTDFYTPALVFNRLDLPSLIPGNSVVDENWSRDQKSQAVQICGLNRLIISDYYYNQPFLACGNNTASYRYFVLDSNQREVSLRMQAPQPARDKNSSSVQEPAGVRAFFFEKSCQSAEAIAGEAIKVKSHRSWPNTSYSPGICRWDIQLRAGDYQLWFERVQFRPPVMLNDKRFNSADCDLSNPDLDYLEVKAASEQEAPILMRYCYYNLPAAKQKPLSVNSSSGIVLTFVAGLSQLEQNVQTFPGGSEGDRKISIVGTENSTFGFELQVARVRNTSSSDFCRRDNKFNVYRMIRRRSPDNYDYGHMATQAGRLYPRDQHCIVNLEADDSSTKFNFTFRGMFDMEQSPDCRNDYLLIEDIIQASAISTTSVTTTTSSPKLTPITKIKTSVSPATRKPDKVEAETTKKVGRWCGRNRPDGYFMSQSSKVRITFHSNSYVEGAGFNLEYNMFDTFM